MKKAPDSVSCLCIHSNKLLLLHRDNFSHIYAPNLWCFPGGGIDEGETPIEACKRELMEEICIIPNDIKFLFSMKNIKNGHIVHFYTSTLSDLESNSVKLGNEGQELRFFEFKDLKTLEIVKELRAGMEAIEKLILGESIADWVKRTSEIDHEEYILIPNQNLQN